MTYFRLANLLFDKIESLGFKRFSVNEQTTRIVIRCDDNLLSLTQYQGGKHHIAYNKLNSKELATPIHTGSQKSCVHIINQMLEMFTL